MAKFENESYDALVNEAAGLTDLVLRTTRLNSAEALLLEEYPVAPLYFYVSKHLVSNRLKNFQDNVLDRHPTQFLRLEEIK